MFIKLKQKIKKYYAKILSKKFSGFGILNINLSFRFIMSLLKEWIPAFAGMTKRIFCRKVLLGVFLMAMIFGGVFGGVSEIRAIYSEGDCFPTPEECKKERKIHNNDPNMGINEPLLRCVQEGEQYCLRIGSRADIFTEKDVTGAIVNPLKKGAITVVGVILNYLGNIIFAIVYFICWILLHVVGLFVNLAAFFLNATLNPDLYIETFGPNSTIVNEGWRIIRDICNMFFILILLVISLATILRIQTYKAQSLLLPLLIAAFLVNFSRPIVEVAIDASQLLMYQFVNMIGTGPNGAIDAGGLTAAKDAIIAQFSGWDLFGEILGGDFMTDALNWVIGIMFALVFLIALCFVYLAMALFMIIRLVALTILIILSPIGFFFNILPQTKSYASKYWSELSKYLIFGPVMAFFIYLASFLAVNVSDLRAELQAVSATGTVGAFSGILQYIIVLVFLYASIYIARELGIAGADKVAGMTTGKLAAGGAFLGGAVGGYMSRSLAKGKLPWQDTVRGVTRRLMPGGKKLDKWVQGVAKKKMTTKSGKEISVGRIKEQALGLFSPGGVKRGYEAHVTDEEAEAYGISSGRMQDLIERTWVMGYKKPTHEELARQSRVADIQNKAKTNNPMVLTNLANTAIEEEDAEATEAYLGKLAVGGDIDGILKLRNFDNSGDGFDAFMRDLSKWMGVNKAGRMSGDIAELEAKDFNFSYIGQAGQDAKTEQFYFNDKKTREKLAREKFDSKDPYTVMKNVSAKTFNDEVVVRDKEGNPIVDEETGKIETEQHISDLGKNIYNNSFTVVHREHGRKSKPKTLKKLLEGFENEAAKVNDLKEEIGMLGIEFKNQTEDILKGTKTTVINKGMTDAEKKRLKTTEKEKDKDEEDEEQELYEKEGKK